LAVAIKDDRGFLLQWKVVDLRQDQGGTQKGNRFGEPVRGRRVGL